MADATPTPTPPSKRPQSQAALLVALATKRIDQLVTTAADGQWVTLSVTDSSGGTHLEHWPLTSKGFKRWLIRTLYDATRKVPSEQALKEAVALLDGKASFEGDRLPVALRVAEYDGKLLYDLADDHWRTIEMTFGGVHVIEDWGRPRCLDWPPVRFKRTNGMLPQVVPDLTGPPAARLARLDWLWDLVNVRSDDDRLLLLAWLTACLRPSVPIPILAVTGEQGSAKSTVSSMLRTLVDPNVAPLRSEPKDERDLMVAAVNGWVFALDNLSYVAPWLSDGLCRLATGGGLSTRTLYENSEESILEAKRPVLLNGIEDVATRSDLLDRIIPLRLPPIPDGKRRTEREVWERFEAARPGIFGGLLTLASEALRLLPTVRLETLPRMADFAEWGVAVELALGRPAGAFMRAYGKSREDTNQSALEASPLFGPLMTIFEKAVARHGQWEGTATALLKELQETPDGITAQGTRGWPANSRALSCTLHRLAPNLRRAGIDAHLDERANDRNRSRLIRLAPVADDGDAQDEPETALPTPVEAPTDLRQRAAGPVGSPDGTSHLNHGVTADGEHGQPAAGPIPLGPPLRHKPAIPCPKCGAPTVLYDGPRTVWIEDEEARWRVIWDEATGERKTVRVEPAPEDRGHEVTLWWWCPNGHGDDDPLIGQVDLPAVTTTWDSTAPPCEYRHVASRKYLGHYEFGPLRTCPGTLHLVEVWAGTRQHPEIPSPFRCDCCAKRELLPLYAPVDRDADPMAIPGDRKSCPTCGHFGAPTTLLRGEHLPDGPEGRWYVCRGCGKPYQGAVEWIVGNDTDFEKDRVQDGDVPEVPEDEEPEDEEPEDEYDDEEQAA